ncbi:thiamine pyrophosphokinase [Phyllosticta capitalensis]
MNPFRPARFMARPPSLSPSAVLPSPHQHTRPALLILNQPVSSTDLLERLWAHSDYRICADGGANRLFDAFVHDHVRRDQFLPSQIHGDLDSLRPSVRDYYAAKGVPISRDHDQYSTDFGKAVKQITAAVPAAPIPYPSPSPSPAPSSTPGRKTSAPTPADSPTPSSFTDPSTLPPQPSREILIMCTLGGRVDQGLGLLYEMLRIQLAYPDTRLWLFSESSVSFILPAGRNELHLPVQLPPSSSSSSANPLHETRQIGHDEDLAYFTENVGILPAFGPAVISTKGLEWDVTDWPTSVDGNVSTSNHVRSPVVEVTTSAIVLFTIERAERLP